MTAALAQAALPTARAIRWAPVAGVALLLVLVAVLASADARASGTVLALAAAALAASVVSSLHDPAAHLLAAVPVSPMRRRVLRLGLTGAPALALWWLLVTVAQPVHGGPGPLLALASCGVAVAVWAPPRRGVVLGASTPVALFALGRVVPGSGAAADVLGWWLTDPWWVLGLATLACLAGRRR